jgi:hypothetical protein
MPISQKCGKQDNILFTLLSKVSYRCPRNPHLPSAITELPSVPNLTQNDQEIWKLRVEICLCPYVRCDCDCANLHGPRAGSTAFLRRRIARTCDKLSGRWYQVTDELTRSPRNVFLRRKERVWWSRKYSCFDTVEALRVASFSVNYTLWEAPACIIGINPREAFSVLEPTNGTEDNRDRCSRYLP